MNMPALTHPLSVLSLILLQATPEPSPLRVAVVGGNKSFLPETLVEWAGLLSAAAIVAGGIWALRSYREGQRLKASEILLAMEQEFRIILPTYELIENPTAYQEKLVPLLQAVASKSSLSNKRIRLLADLDRCLRFLFLCSVLNQDLAVEQNALVRAYYYYVGILASLADEDNVERVDLAKYVNEFYPTLCKWTKEHQAQLEGYRAGQPWKSTSWPRLRTKFSRNP